jgi:uncharacterized protein (TIGR03086 family)
MTTAPGVAGPTSTLATSAIDYLRGSLSAAATAPLDAATPCPDWDLSALVLHVADVADAVTGCLATGELVMPEPTVAVSDPLDLVRRRLAGSADAIDLAVTAGTETPGLMTALQVAAIEFTLHGWDIAEAAGREDAMRSDLARDVLELVSSLVPTEGDGRPFGRVVPSAAGAGPIDRLVGFAGRRPRR